MDLQRRTFLAGGGCLLLTSETSKRAGAGSAPSTLAARLSASGYSVERKSFGMHLVGVTGWDQDHGVASAPLNFGCGSVRVWDTGATWRRIEKAKGGYDWSYLDAEISIWKRSFSDIIYCLGQAPDWATYPLTGKGSYNPHPPNKIQDCVDFAVSLVQRYPEIKAVEMWNEPNFDRFYTGSIAQLALLTKAQASAIRKVRPDVKIATAAPQPFADSGSYFDKYLAALKAIGAHDLIDVVSFHTYVQPRQPERMGALIDLLRSIARRNGFDQPLWSTEFGWGEYKSAPYSPISTKTPMGDNQAISYILRAYLVSLGHGLERQYFYAADKSFNTVPLINRSNKTIPSAAGVALNYLIEVMRGGRTWRYNSQGTHFEQRFATRDNVSGTVYWTTDNTNVNIDLSHATRITDWMGKVLPSTSNFLLGSEPIYVFMSPPRA
jgi:hypothetical protein